MIAECAAATGINPGTLRNAKMVCLRIPVSCRRDTLSWTHHCEVGIAFANPPEIERWLAVAESDGLSAMALRRRIRSHVASRREQRGASPDEASTTAFQLMRELRAGDRMLELLRRTGLPPRCQHQFAPVDTPEAVSRFLDHWQPSLALAARSPTSESGAT